MPPPHPDAATPFRDGSGPGPTGIELAGVELAGVELAGRERAGVELAGVDVAIDGVPILRDVTWTIGAGERWVVVGPNGSGKTTLLRLLGAWVRPWSGSARVLGETLGRTDMRALRRRIGYTSQALSDALRPTMTPHEIVLAGPNGALETWWHRYDDDAHAAATHLLGAFGIDEGDARRRLDTLSAGERQRVLLARAFCAQPGLVLLDEPTAGLDLGGREDLLARLDRVARSSTAPMVLVTHHLEEIPPAFDRVVLMRAGRLVDAGAAADLLTSDRLSDLYGLALTVRRDGGRWSAVAAG